MEEVYNNKSRNGNDPSYFEDDQKINSCTIYKTEDEKGNYFGIPYDEHIRIRSSKLPAEVVPIPQNETGIEVIIGNLLMKCLNLKAIGDKQAFVILKCLYNRLSLQDFQYG